MRITTRLPDTRFVAPSDAQLAALLKIVEAARPPLRGKVGAEEFKRAFIAAGYFWRTSAPRRDHYFGHWVALANDMLAGVWGLEGVSGDAFLAAVHAHGDVAWRAPDPRLGVILEVGLDPYTGAYCNNTWRGLLDGSANLLAPIPPNATLREAVERGPARIYVEDRGRMREIGADRPLWNP